jgi:hypothetical protein
MDNLEVGLSDCVRTAGLVQYVKVADNSELHDDHRRRITPIEQHVSVTNAALLGLQQASESHARDLSNYRVGFAGSIGTLNDEQAIQDTNISALQTLQSNAGTSIDLLNSGMDDHDNRMNNMDSVTANLHDNLVIAVGHIQTLLADGILMSQRIADLEYVVYTRTSAAIVVQSGISGTSRLFQRTDTWFNTSTGASVELPLLPGGSYKCKFVMIDTTSSQSGLKGFAGVFDLMLPTVTTDVNHLPYLDVPCSFFHNDSTHGVPLIQFRPTSQNQWNLFLTWPSPDSTKTADSFTLDLTVKSMNW